MLKDGNYDVVAKGYLKDRVPLTVTISNGKISEIKPRIKFAKDGLQDTVYSKLTAQIIKQQNTDVDAVSGASYSRKGLIDAVNEVLKKAGSSDVKDNSEKIKQEDWLPEEVAPHNDDYSAWRKIPEKVDKEISTDFLIIGAGISGLAAAVQAGENHMDVTVIDKNGFVAGNGGGVEGIFGINTKMQKEAGIHTKPEEIIAKEMRLAQYRPNGSVWVDLVRNSAENIDWLVKQGVQLTKVDDYHGTCEFPTFHWFKGGVASIGYAPYMKKRADELGVKFILGTAATSIIFEDNRIKGVYAKDSTGAVLKINTKAVLLATGGVGHNASLIAKQGWQTKNLHFLSMPSTTGDGYQMAMSLGAKDMLQESPEFIMNYIQALPMHRLANMSNDPISGLRAVPAGFSAIYVDQDGRRFVAEDISKENLLNQRMAIKSTKAAYEIFTKKVYDNITQSLPDADPNADEILEESVKTNRGNSLYKEDTIEDLAKHFDIPADTLVKTMNDYNRYCHEGRDEEFNKDKSMLIAMDEGPYYIARLDPSNLIGVGGIGSNNKFEVIDKNFNKIPGLYVSGMDSTMQYRNVYTITLGGSACAHNVNSGRHAAINAQEYIKSL